MTIHIMTIGIDEVGRGPLAGPVVVACVALPSSFALKANEANPPAGGLKPPLPLRDSKKLTANQREAWCLWIKQHPKIKYAIARSSPTTIDKINISQATNRAAYRAYQKLVNLKANKLTKLKPLLDAGLRLPRTIPQQAIIKGDEKIPAIALASILAKVARDAYMTRMHARYPQYGFKKNKGYGTTVHMKALKCHGPCPLHRLTFIKKFVTLKTNPKAN